MNQQLESHTQTVTSLIKKQVADALKKKASETSSLESQGKAQQEKEEAALSSMNQQFQKYKGEVDKLSKDLKTKEQEQV